MRPAVGDKCLKSSFAFYSFFCLLHLNDSYISFLRRLAGSLGLGIVSTSNVYLMSMLPSINKQT